LRLTGHEDDESSRFVMRILALDVGKKKIGLAVSDPLGVTARPYLTVERNQHGLQKIVDTIQQLDVKEILIGLPLHLDGSEGDQAKDVRAFAERLSQKVGSVPFKFWDERLTSVEAQERLSDRRGDWRKSKKEIDAFAAAILLEAYLLER
jgi:putative holliday junction resolvase